MAGHRCRGRRTASCREATENKPAFGWLARSAALPIVPARKGRLVAWMRENQTRIETDSFGPIEVPANTIGARRPNDPARISRSARERMPPRSFMPWRWSSGPPPRSIATSDFCRHASVRRDRHRGRRNRRLARLDAEFPLGVWQTGSGTQTNMNVNEVIANRANETPRRAARGETSRPPQRSRQSRPILERLFSDRHAYRRRPSNQAKAGTCLCARFDRAFAAKSEAFAAIIKTGRTHLQDATPVTLGQEFSAMPSQLEFGLQRLDGTLPGPLPACPGRHGGRHRSQYQTGFCRTPSPRGSRP